MKLTEKNIAALPVTGKRYSKSDDGLAVEVTPAGSKTFVFWHKGRKYTIGSTDDWSLKDARVEFMKRRVSLAEKPSDDTAKGRMTFRAFVEGPYREQGAAQRQHADLTMENVERVFLRMFPRLADKQLRKVTTEDIEILKLELTGHYAASTAKRNLSDLKHIFNCALRWKYIVESPAEGVRDPKVDRNAAKLYLSDSELKRLTAALEDWRVKGLAHDAGFVENYGRGFFGNTHPLWFYVLVKIYLNTGLRRDEGIHLRWGDIDFEENVITVRGEGAKSGQTRQIPMPPALVEALEEFYTEEHDQQTIADDTVDPGERLFKVKGIRKPWARLREMAGMDDRFAPHLLRHNFASHHANKKGTPLTVIRDLCGHADLATTQRYLSVRREDLRAAQAVSIG